MIRPRIRLPRGALEILAAAVLALGGCASVPQATPERDAEAKQFITRPDAATHLGTDRSSHAASHRSAIARANATLTDRHAVSAAHDARPHAYLDSNDG